MKLSTVELVRLAKMNDSQAKEMLINENSPLIKSVIKRYRDKGVEYEDLYQLGSLGFLKAIDNFDEGFNVKFTTYAVTMIAGEVKRFLRDSGYIKVSRSVKSLNMHINKFVEEYKLRFDKSPQLSEIADYFQVANEDIVFAMESNKLPVSLSSLVGDDNGKQQMLIEKIEGDNMDKDMDLFLIYNLIKELDKRDRKIIMLRYFRDKTQKEIAELFGVSQVQISRLETKILNQIKTKIGCKMTS